MGSLVLLFAVGAGMPPFLNFLSSTLDASGSVVVLLLFFCRVSRIIPLAPYVDVQGSFICTLLVAVRTAHGSSFVGDTWKSDLDLSCGGHRGSLYLAARRCFTGVVSCPIFVDLLPSGWVATRAQAGINVAAQGGVSVEPLVAILALQVVLVLVVVLYLPRMASFPGFCLEVRGQALFRSEQGRAVRAWDVP